MYNHNRQRKLRALIKSKNVPSTFFEPCERTGRNTFGRKFFVDLCSNSSFHGLNHFVDNERPRIEKLLWAILLVMAVIGTVYSIHEIWFSYIQGSTETVVETTYFKNAQIAFPAVTICQASRVDWTKVKSLKEANIPEYSNETEPAILALLKALSSIEFGEFDEFEIIRQHKDVLPKLRTLRIADLLLKVATRLLVGNVCCLNYIKGSRHIFDNTLPVELIHEPLQVLEGVGDERIQPPLVIRTCDEVFIGRCWWRMHEIDCCAIFELQKTKFGYCYSFNSDLTEHSKKISAVKNGINSYWRDPDGVIRPRRTGSRGQWSGLRLTASTPASIIPPLKPLKPGVKVLVGEPRAYFIGGELTVPAGQHGLIHIWGDRIYSTQRLRNLNPSKRHCLYSDEESALGLPYYLRQNCKADCYKDHVYKYCNCSPDFMFFEINENNPKYPPCTASDLLCLSEYNSVFNNILPNYVKSYENERNETSMTCDCKPDCSHQMYIGEITAAGDSNFTQEIFLDIHFRQSTCILYRTDLMFGWLDLIVSFGGCTGLFLGGSILSCFELIYFLTIRLYCQWRTWNAVHPKPASSTQKE